MEISFISSTANLSNFMNGFHCDIFLLQSAYEVYFQIFFKIFSQSSTAGFCLAKVLLQSKDYFWKMHDCLAENVTNTNSICYPSFSRINLFFLVSFMAPTSMEMIVFLWRLHKTSIPLQMALKVIMDFLSYQKGPQCLQATLTNKKIKMHFLIV